MTHLTDTAREFFKLHRPGDPFVLPCVWDVASAKLLAARGFPALGTTSLGLAAAFGLRDEDRGTRTASLALVERIRSSTKAELISCDIEDGYSDDAGEVASFVQALDVEGVNIEDSLARSLTDPKRHAHKIRTLKARVPGIFINARVDTFWTGEGDMSETLERIDRYVDAGADGIFVPGDLKLAEIALITEHAPVPVNVLATGRHSRSALASAGVARISTGSLLYRAAITAAVNAALDFAGERPLSGEALGYEVFQEL